ncbi:MAG TPA: amphi-Trp domain-containing protein [Polyangiaceae bacterium]|nr:amphi-Trp domain-containing protein [Polyangiaceae bacterium]
MATSHQDPSLDLEQSTLEDDDDEEGAGDSVSQKSKDKAKAKIKFASVMQRGEAVAYFAALVDGLRHGRLQFRHGMESVALEPGEQVAIEVKASRKGDKERVSFELEWKRPPREALEVTG